MGWFFNNNDDSNDKSLSKENSINSNFRVGYNSITKECRTDPEDQNFLICKIKENRTQNINGKDTTNTIEREERIPRSNDRNNIFQSNFSTQLRPFTTEFFSNINRAEDDIGNIEDQFRNSLNNLFGNSLFFFDDMFKEMDKNFSHFHESQFRPSYNNQSFYNHQKENPKQDYNFQFRQNKSDKDIYDV